MKVLDKISTPLDVKKLNIEELKALAEEIRAEILSVTEKNGGHLASNLGIVETTIALYYAFDFSKDKIIFDVGHQCYAHKILSGRKEDFQSIRTGGGISGFPDRGESSYDAFGAGHAGSSLSAGLGFATARDKRGEDYYVVTVIGDGSFANGLNLEALTVSDTKPNKHIVILNDNGMSISKNKNGLYRAISKATAKKGYIRSKRSLKKVFGSSFIGSALVGMRNFVKRIVKKDDYFEKYGYKYVGVVDGNDINELNKIIERVKYASEDKAIFLHVKTTKGKGYEKAEEHAEMYHGVGALLKNEAGNMSHALGEKLCSLIDNDDKIVAITAGMKDGTGLYAVEKNHPKNFFDVGIAEEFAVTYAGGMSAGGLKPVVSIYSTFLQRSYDQILHDVCLQNLPVVFCIDRAGVVGPDGKTHQGVFDLSYLSHLPNMRILAPATVFELESALEYALALSSPVAIRYPKNTTLSFSSPSYEKQDWVRLKEGNRVTILAVGARMLDIALKASEKSLGVGVINARTVKPLCDKTLDQIKDTALITLEENSLIGGFGSLVLTHYNDRGISVKLTSFGIKDAFVEHGKVDEQLEKNGISLDKILETINSIE